MWYCMTYIHDVAYPWLFEWRVERGEKGQYAKVIEERWECGCSFLHVMSKHMVCEAIPTFNTVEGSWEMWAQVVIQKPIFWYAQPRPPWKVMDVEGRWECGYSFLHIVKIAVCAAIPTGNKLPARATNLPANMTAKVPGGKPRSTSFDPLS